MTWFWIGLPIVLVPAIAYYMLAAARHRVLFSVLITLVCGVALFFVEAKLIPVLIMLAMASIGTGLTDKREPAERSKTAGDVAREAAARA